MHYECNRKNIEKISCCDIKRDSEPYERNNYCDQQAHQLAKERRLKNLIKYALI